MIMIKTGLGINMRKFLSLNLLFFLFIFSISSSEARAKSWLGVEFRPLTKEFIELNNLNLDPNKKLIVSIIKRKIKIFDCYFLCIFCPLLIIDL